MQKIKEFISDNSDEIFVTGGVSEETLGELERSLSIYLCESMRKFLSECGMLLGFGIEILGCGKNGKSPLVNETIKYRELGLNKNYIVIRNVDEWVYCLDNNTGVIYSWDRIDKTYLKCADSLEDYILIELNEAKADWE